MSYEDLPLFQSLSAQLIFGGITAKGNLPITASSEFMIGMGLKSQRANRLKYTMPEEVGIKTKYLLKIDSIAYEAIHSQATPGCQILIAKDGKIFYQKSFGYFTYDSATMVSNSSIYDLASVTKVSSTLPALMKLYDEKKLKLDDSLKTYLPQTQNTNKADLVIKEILSHKAGLKDWIPFYMETIKDGEYLPDIYSCDSNGVCTIKVARELFINGHYRDTIMKKIFSSPLRSTRDYMYSDLGFYLMMYLTEGLTQTPLDQYTEQNFYKPLGATTLCYNPLRQFPSERIVPTEDDKTFRKQIVQGYVHDPGAAMMGGICGHAGLFSNANDLAKLMQTYLWNGFYGGEKYFDSTTVKEFTKCHYCVENNRRALGFDRTDPQIGGFACSCVSAESFGHTGFTGTIVWMDPENGLLYIFLSNRVYPDVTNSKLNKMNIRSRIQEVVYDALQNAN
jgi:CubicO group peptidase (beta-lactamase class C family)